MRPQSAKAKGRRLQQKIAQSIVDAFPHLEPDDAVSTSMGCGGMDVRLSPLAQRTIPLAIECKNQERLNVWACLEQAEKNTPDGMDSCLIFSRNHARTYAVLPWETVVRLYQARHQLESSTSPPTTPAPPTTPPPTDESAGPSSSSSSSSLPPRVVALLKELMEWVPREEASHMTDDA